jgi:hypothetical protein
MIDAQNAVEQRFTERSWHARATDGGAAAKLLQLSVRVVFSQSRESVARAQHSDGRRRGERRWL